jgi:hypothetical protein
VTVVTDRESARGAKWCQVTGREVKSMAERKKVTPKSPAAKATSKKRAATRVNKQVKQVAQANQAVMNKLNAL